MKDGWFIALGICFGLAFFSAWGGNRKWARIWAVGVVGSILAGAYKIPFPADTTEGLLSLSLGLFVWIAPVVVIGFLIWLFIKVFSSAVASEVVRKQIEKQ
jgi:hypothetical protein